MRVTVTAGLMALFTLGYQAEKDAIPLSSRTPAATKQRAMSATVFLGRSARSYGVGNYRDAIEAARHALRCQPGMAEAWNNIAASYAALRMWDDAIAAAQEAIRLKPDFELAKNNLAWAANEKARQSEVTPANPASVPR